MGLYTAPPQVWDMRLNRSVRSMFGPYICGDAVDVRGNKVLTGGSSWETCSMPACLWWSCLCFHLCSKAGQQGPHWCRFGQKRIGKLVFLAVKRRYICGVKRPYICGDAVGVRGNKVLTGGSPWGSCFLPEVCPCIPSSNGMKPSRLTPRWPYTCVVPRSPLAFHPTPSAPLRFHASVLP